MLRVYFSSGQFLTWFPLGEVVSDNYIELLSFGAKILDRIHHFVLPLICYVDRADFLVLTVLMKNSLIDEINLDYVRTARAKGLNENAGWSFATRCGTP